MKLLIAGLATETNTFSPMPTGRLAFESTFVTRSATELEPNLFSAPLHEWRRLATERGWEVVESRCAFAQPAGITVREVYESYRDEILRDVAESKPDIVLLSMHGAMVAQGYDDCEGDTCKRIRDLIGPTKILGLELDPHNHLTAEMLQHATLIVSYKEYPHIDSADRARELFAMAADAAQGKTRPVMRVYDCKMLTIIETLREPGKGFVQAMKDAEGKDGVLSVSLTHGFPWADVADIGAKTLVITDGDPDLALQQAKHFGDLLWEIREDLLRPYPGIEAALDQLERADVGPITLADMGDNAGGGAPADSTFFLQAVLKRRLKDVALGVFWDPVLVTMCQDAGVGAKLQVRIGGKICVDSGDPVDLSVTVRGIKEDMRMFLGESSMPMGTGVLLSTDEGVHIVVSSIRTQCFSPSAFSELGLDITSLRAMVPKSTNHFYQNFAAVSAQVVHVGSPGAVTPDMTQIAFTKFKGAYWPKVDNPWI